MGTDPNLDEGPVRGGRVARKREQRVRAILAIAAELLGERGYERVSLEDVAERLDLTKASLYHYFPSKDALVSAAIDGLGADWNARLEDRLARTQGDATQRLGALIHEHTTIAVREYPAALRLFLAPADWPPAQRAAITALRRHHDRLFRREIEAGICHGEFVVTDVDTVLRCLHAAMSQAPSWCGPRPGRSVERAIDDLCDTLLCLVGRPPQPR